MKSIEKLPIEEVTWEDHFSSTEWMTQDDMDKDDGCIFVTTIGYRLKETKLKIILAQNVADNGHVAGLMTIIKKTVTKRTTLREAQ